MSKLLVVGYDTTVARSVLTDLTPFLRSSASPVLNGRVPLPAQRLNMPVATFPASCPVQNGHIT